MPRRIPALIVHWNNPDGALRTARSIRRHAPFCDVIIIENGSPAAARAEIERSARAEGFRLVCLEKNSGFTGGMNHGVVHSELCAPGDFALCSCHGVEVTAGCVEKLVAAMEADERVGLVAPRIPQDSPAIFGATPGWESRSGSDYVEIERTSGALLLHRVAAFRAVGGYDERMFAYYEDIDLAKRLRKTGWKVGMVPDALILEDGSTLPFFGRIYLIARNQIISSQQDGPAAVARQVVRTAMSSGRCLLASIAPWRPADRRAQSWMFARGNFFAVTDALAGVTGPGRAFRIAPKRAG